MQETSNGDGVQCQRAEDAITHQSEEANNEVGRDATELRAFSPQRLPETPDADGPTTAPGYIWRLKAFWRRQISVSVPHEQSRDYLALERTYLAYIRTSLMISMVGIMIAQFFRIQHSVKPNPSFGYFVLGTPLGCLCQALSCCLAIIGAHRYWRQQNAMVRGKVRAGGWEITATGIAALVLTLVLFGILVAVDISKEL